MPNVSPDNVLEFRTRYQSSASLAHEAASAAGWAAGTAKKIKLAGPITGFEEKGIADPGPEDRMDAYGAYHPALRRGAPKFPMLLDRGNGTTTPTEQATFLSKIMGGLRSPATTATDTVEAGTTATVVTKAGHTRIVGEVCLCGTRGDARGNAEVRWVTAVTANTYTLNMATKAAMSAGDTVWFAHVVYLDADADQQYIDGLVVGYDATVGAADQRQWITGMGGFGLSNLLVPGEAPQIDFEMQCIDHQEVPPGEETAISPATGYDIGARPPIDKSMGGFFMQDAGVTTRKLWRADDIQFAPNFAFEPVKDPNGVNGWGGFRRVRAAPGSGPMLSFGLPLEGDSDIRPGLRDDFKNRTAKQVLFQIGHETSAGSGSGCVAIGFKRGRLTGVPEDAPDGNFRGAKVEMQIDEAADKSTDLIASSWFMAVF